MSANLDDEEAPPDLTKPTVRDAVREIVREEVGAWLDRLKWIGISILGVVSFLGYTGWASVRDDLVDFAKEQVGQAPLAAANTEVERILRDLRIRHTQTWQTGRCSLADGYAVRDVLSDPESPEPVFDEALSLSEGCVEAYLGEGIDFSKIADAIAKELDEDGIGQSGFPRERVAAFIERLPLRPSDNGPDERLLASLERYVASDQRRRPYLASVLRRIEHDRMGLWHLDPKALEAIVRGNEKDASDEALRGLARYFPNSEVLSDWLTRAVASRSLADFVQAMEASSIFARPGIVTPRGSVMGDTALLDKVMDAFLDLGVSLYHGRDGTVEVWLQEDAPRLGEVHRPKLGESKLDRLGGWLSQSASRIDAALKAGDIDRAGELLDRLSVKGTGGCGKYDLMCTTFALEEVADASVDPTARLWSPTARTIVEWPLWARKSDGGPYQVYTRRIDREGVPVVVEVEAGDFLNGTHVVVREVER
ncbi:MAG: hypothetical protein H6737_32240 [Alphaproteobacteria bacterium]|nr:hypothetical protein [Alphaproteobacteria bacterium]